MNVEIVKNGKGSQVVITLPIEPMTSKSGKSLIIAGTGGFKPTSAQYEGKPVKISVNVIV